MYDQYVTRHAVSDFAAFNLDDVDEAFARITPLKYQQTLTLEGKAAERVLDSQTA